MLKLELEAAEFEDSADICNKTRSLTIGSGTPLMPYTEPTFANEGMVERLIDENINHMSIESQNKKKRSRRDFETPNMKRPLLCPSDELASTEVSSLTKSKFNKHVLTKTSSNLNQRRIVLLK